MYGRSSYDVFPRPSPANSKLLTFVNAEGRLRISIVGRSLNLGTFITGLRFPMASSQCSTLAFCALRLSPATSSLGSNPNSGSPHPRYPPLWPLHYFASSWLQVTAVWYPLTLRNLMNLPSSANWSWRIQSAHSGTRRFNSGTTFLYPRRNRTNGLGTMILRRVYITASQAGHGWSSFVGPIDEVFMSLG
jgi:hypothetical protein